MPVFVGPGLERVRVPMSDVLEVVRIRACAEYAGIRFRMGPCGERAESTFASRFPSLPRT